MLAYDELQDAVAEATAGIHAERVLELSVGTGETSRRVLDVHPEAELVGIDESAEMLAAVSAGVAAADLRVTRLEDPLPQGNFDLVVSALAVHHRDGAGKADLFARVADRLRPADGSCSPTSWYPRIRPTSSHQSTACTSSRAP